MKTRFTNKKLNNMKKYLTTLLLTFLTLIFFSCNNNNSKGNNKQSPIISSDSNLSKEIQTDKLDNIVNSIINLSANDFYKNQQPTPVDFKNVKLKYIKKPNGEELYILCGQFVTNDKQETQFATVKNSDYEQWVGNSALTYCQNSKEITYTKENLSSALKNKFNSLKK
ncbi:MAG TPA: hypothetical protein PKD67_09085 [Ignavibacteriaceae bacterium]|nr:hypothetical protein [Ignavibacteriaceae bacterium]